MKRRCPSVYEIPGELVGVDVNVSVNKNKCVNEFVEDFVNAHELLVNHSYIPTFLSTQAVLVLHRAKGHLVFTNYTKCPLMNVLVNECAT